MNFAPELRPLRTRAESNTVDLGKHYPARIAGLMSQKRAQNTARQRISKMRELTRDVSKLNGRIHSESSKNGSTGSTPKPSAKPTP